MPVKTAAGTKVFISAATSDATDTVAEYDALAETGNRAGAVKAMP